MGFEEPPDIETDTQVGDFTRITFRPDLSKFNLRNLDETTFELMRRRTVDVAGTLSDVEVLFNGERIDVSFECSFDFIVFTFSTWRLNFLNSN